MATVVEVEVTVAEAVAVAVAEAGRLYTADEVATGGVHTAAAAPEAVAGRFVAGVFVFNVFDGVLVADPRRRSRSLHVAAQVEFEGSI